MQFLVQSDFITQASREGIHQCPWNDAILDGVAETFCDAVLRFCHDSSLQYKWLRHVPGKSISDPFWARLRDKIFDLLQWQRILRTWSGTRLEYPLKVRQLGSVCLDRYGQPLFDDLEEEIYLSPHYEWSPALDHLGVDNITYPQLIPRIQKYLEGNDPRILQPVHDDDWHTRVAYLLQNGLGDNPPSVVNSIKDLPLIPLLNGELSSAVSKEIFFPYDENGIPIPTDLDFYLVEPPSIRNKERKSLFKALGVGYCKPDLVVDRITRRYDMPDTVDLGNSISHLRYLYWSLPQNASLDVRTFLIDKNEMPVYSKLVAFGSAIVDDLYFETDGTYGVKRLAQEVGSQEIHFLHPSYLDAVPSDVRRHGRSWVQWLEDVAAVRRIPRLKERSGSPRLSKVFRRIVERCPNLLIGVLKSYWDYYDLDKTPEVLRELGDAVVPCENTEPKSLRDTYLPLTDLKDMCADFTVCDKMPFLRLPSEFRHDNLLEWEFLAKLEVGTKADLWFFVDALRYLVQKNQQGCGEEARKGLFKVYEEIAGRCPDTEHENIRLVYSELI